MTAMMSIVVGGGIGGLVGGPVGAGAGFALCLVIFSVTRAALRVGAAELSAGVPIVIRCPDCGERTKVKVDPRQARWSALTHERPVVKVCARWQGAPQCQTACAQQVAAKL